MLVAKKEQSYYYDEHDFKPKRKKIKKNKNKVKNKLRIFMFAFIILNVCLVILLRYAFITHIRLDITKFTNKEIELQKNKQELINELDTIKNSYKIEQDAKLKLGMNYPTDDQIVHVNIDENIFKEKVNKSNGFPLIKYFKNVFNLFFNLF